MWLAQVSKRWIKMRPRSSGLRSWKDEEEEERRVGLVRDMVEKT